MHPKTGGMGRINDIAIRYVAKLSGKGVSTVQRVKRLKIHNHSNKTINFTFFSKKRLCNSGLKAKSTTFECC